MPLILEYIVVVILGLILGSFATALVYRAPRDIPWGFFKSNKINRSVCTNCQTPLTARDLVPVFSWLMLGGKCRTCKHKIGTVYLYTELLTLLACLGIYWAGGLSALPIIAMFMMPFLTALLVIDLQTMTLPNKLVLSVAVLALVRLITETFFLHTMDFQDMVFNYIIAGFVYGALAWILGQGVSKVLKKDALGMGDVKFFAAAGLWLGMSPLGWFCLASGIFGVGLGFLWKALKKGDVFPFGPAIILSLYVLLII